MNTQERRELRKLSIQWYINQANSTLEEVFLDECQRTVNQWKERWPNHTFTIQSFMGNLSAKVSPPVIGCTYIPSECPILLNYPDGRQIRQDRGAIKDLINEWIEFSNWWNELLQLQLDISLEDDEVTST